MIKHTNPRAYVHRETQTPNNGENSTHITKAGTERREQLQLIFDSNSIQFTWNKNLRDKSDVVTNQFVSVY